MVQRLLPGPQQKRRFRDSCTVLPLYRAGAQYTAEASRDGRRGVGPGIGTCRAPVERTGGVADT